MRKNTGSERYAQANMQAGPGSVFIEDAADQLARGVPWIGAASGISLQSPRLFSAWKGPGVTLSDPAKRSAIGMLRGCGTGGRVVHFRPRRPSLSLESLLSVQVKMGVKHKLSINTGK